MINYTKNLNLTFMKKLLFIMFLFIAGNLNANNSTLISSDDDINTQEVEIREKEKGNTIQDTRQIVQPAVEALLDSINGELTFSFNENIGEVVITITNDCGDVVATSVCNGNFGSSTTIIVPTAAGSYNIEIAGTQYNGYGEYEL